VTASAFLKGIPFDIRPAKGALNAKDTPSAFVHYCIPIAFV
jgi:hypothetical protein